MQGIIDCKGTETQQLFSRMFAMAKKIKELFASTLNEIPASVRCVPSMIVILNVKFARLLAAHAKKKDSEERRSPTRVSCFANKNT